MMKKIFTLLLLLAVGYVNAQSVFLDTSLTSDVEGEITEYWYWAAGIEVEGTDFSANEEITVTTTDPENNVRFFYGTADANGAFTIQANAMKIRSILGEHVISATGTSGNTASEILTVIMDPLEVIEATATPNELSISDFDTNGVLLSASGFAPNAEIRINLEDPAGNGMALSPQESLFADAQGNFQIFINGSTLVGMPNLTYPFPLIEGVWSVNFNDFSGTGFKGQTTFRMLPNNPNPSNYCTIDFIQETEAITLVNFAGIDNVTDPNSSIPYEDFTNLEGEVEVGQTYTITLKGRARFDFNVNTYTVFIDWNNNGILNEEGEIYSAGWLTGSTGVDNMQVEYDITIPDNAVGGPTRMRILKVASASSTAMFWPSGSCGDYYFGQAEDYTLNVQNSVGIVDLENNNFKLYPNPVANKLNISANKEIKNVVINDITGRQVSSINIKAANASIDLSFLSTGLYIINATVGNESQTFKIIKE